MGRGDSWPKWTPSPQQYKGHPLLWITFSSRRAYGLRLNTALPTQSAPGTAQIWMAAIDPTRAWAGNDPSYPAFWLPFQDMASGNHIAQWVLKVARKPCASVTDCAGDESCSAGVCVPAIQ
jgi:TolB protein